MCNISLKTRSTAIRHEQFFRHDLAILALMAYLTLAVVAIGEIIRSPRYCEYISRLAHQPQQMWWVITGIGLLTALLLWIYDRTLTPAKEPAKSAA